MKAASETAQPQTQTVENWGWLFNADIIKQYRLCL
jgi:hypothetical protein